MNAANRKGRAGARRDAFSIMEVVVVVAIIVILTVIALPAFRAMVESSEAALAESMLRSAVRAGRDAALRSSEAAPDSAVVFFYEPGLNGGRTVIVPYVKSAVFMDREFSNPAPPAEEILREIFVPDPLGYPAQLPKGWMVRAYAPMGAVEDQRSNIAKGWYNRLGSVKQRYNQKDNWVFPETAFFDAGRHDDGFHRNTFMLRFRGGTGEFVSAGAESALIFAPNMDAHSERGLLGGYRASSPLRELRLSDPARYVRAVIGGGFGASPNQTPLQLGQRASYIGRESSDMVLARPVTQIALYQERDLAAALGIEIDRDTGSLYKPAKNSDDPVAALLTPGPALVKEQVTDVGTSASFWDRVNRWIEGDTNGDGNYFLLDAPDLANRDNVRATLYALDRYSGALRPLVVGKPNQ